MIKTNLLKELKQRNLLANNFINTLQLNSYFKIDKDVSTLPHESTVPLWFGDPILQIWHELICKNTLLVSFHPAINIKYITIQNQ